MNVGQLIAELSKLPPECRVCISETRQIGDYTWDTDTVEIVGLVLWPEDNPRYITLETGDD